MNLFIIKKFYSVDYERYRRQYSDPQLLWTVYFSMDQEYDVYVPYIDYQPVMNSSRRNLSSNDKNIKITLFIQEELSNHLQKHFIVTI